MRQKGKQKPHAKGLSYFRLILMALTLILVLPAFSTAQQANDKTEDQKLLERYANQSLIRLKQAIKSDGFYSARVALNIWQINAVKAGTYDASQYKAFKEQIYKKSINDNLRWFEMFISQKDYADARICLKIWQMHAEEIGVFDEALYTELKKKLE